jgi:hypothetical protein
VTSLQKRVAAAQATLDRFKDQPFKFGKHDCAQLVRWHLRAIGKPAKVAAKAGSYHSLAGGMRALQKLGYKDLIAAMDDHFERIPAAAALPGDVIAMPGIEGPGALTIALGNGRVVGYHEDAPGATVLQPIEMITGWRVI